MKLDLYQVFLSVAKNKSISLAATELYITQPAVSQAIKNLEKELETQLFIRTPRGVSLTEYGDILFGYVEDAMGLISSGEAILDSFRNLKSGTLRIGASDTLCMHMLLPYLGRFHHRYPDVNISVTNRTSGETVKLLNAGSVDIGFINLPTALNEDIQVKKLMEIEDVFVYGEKYYTHFDAPVSLNSLNDCILLMLEKQSSSRGYIDSFFEEQGVTLTPQIELGSLDLLMEFAKAGMGIACVPAEYAKEHISKDTLRTLQTIPSIPKRSIGVIFKKKIPLSNAAKTFYEEIMPIHNYSSFS